MPFGFKVCRDAQAEYKMEQAFKRLQQDWETRLLELERFTLTPGGLTQTQRPVLEAVSESCLDAPHIIIGET